MLIVLDTTNIALLAELPEAESVLDLEKPMPADRQH
jgi:hypothetical protein